MTEIRLESWNQLLDELYAGSWNRDLNRFRSPYVYRGLSDMDYPLLTTLQRLGGNYASMENHLLRNFRKYAHRNIVERDTFWDWVSLGQHHGLPTRLLDWTISPLVAAHFATVNIERYHCHSAIWMVDYRKAHALLPKKLKAELEREGSDFFTTDMLTRVVPTFKDLDALSPPEFLLFFEPPSIDERITNQFALFSAMPGSDDMLSGWLEQHPDIWRKLVIPAGLKMGSAR